MVLARREGQGAIKVREMALEDGVSAAFLEQIMLELKSVGFVESTRGPNGGYQLSRSSSVIQLGEVIRLIDGPLAPLGDAADLRRLVEADARHRSLYKVFLDVRDEIAQILDKTSLADISKTPTFSSGKPYVNHRTQGGQTLGLGTSCANDRD